MFRDYIRLIIFAAGLLIGIQVPSFIDQYHKRVDAHLIEAKYNISGFKKTANKYFKGNIADLIKYYEASSDPVFQADAKSVKSIYLRVKMLLKELAALNHVWYRKAYHVFFHSNETIFNETLAQYSYTVPINPIAIAWGIGFGFFMSLLTELFFMGLWNITQSFFKKTFNKTI